MSIFNIEFEEFKFLVESCIPPSHISRSVFFDDVINKYFYQMTEDERTELYKYIIRNDVCGDDESCEIFRMRFDPQNQYDVYTLYNNEKKVHRAFKRNDNYYTEKNKYIDEEFITKIVKV